MLHTEHEWRYGKDIPPAPSGGGFTSFRGCAPFRTASAGQPLGTRNRVVPRRGRRRIRLVRGRAGLDLRHDQRGQVLSPPRRPSRCSSACSSASTVADGAGARLCIVVRHREAVGLVIVPGQLRVVLTKTFPRRTAADRSDAGRRANADQLDRTRKANRQVSFSVHPSTPCSAASARNAAYPRARLTGGGRAGSALETRQVDPRCCGRGGPPR